ncbi:lipopolysaccharide-induced tumor necrosis factor-alpha factor homolog [Syngnathus typhle]|uniref:lipopolysaccharide-induced tumor necrosis factor-alpha factor homolog n=1 Tax=Syngnathus typhle TaxID=161592 RepID=UPI002A6AF627|nr:lipopolysaccharide-induced tumor necrosis factor-alpha factor homolog [Syngnathus typhle]
MEPPSYAEATLRPPPPPTSQTPSEPPPSYEETINVQPDPFPVLRTPIVTTADTSRRDQAHGGGAHAAPVQEVVVVTQPQPQQTISITELRNHPGYVQCPKCHDEVTTVKVLCPSLWAVYVCSMIALGGLICGFCLIPLCIPSCWNVHHYCPRCHKRIYVYNRGV